MSRTRLPRAVREQQMLDAAVAVFSRRGFHAASMDEIAEVAGISKPMVYAYLGTKEELFVMCLHREGTRLMEAIAEAAHLDARPDEQLRGALHAFLGFVADHRDAWSVLYRQARGQETFTGVLAHMRDRMIDVVAGLLGGTDPDTMLAAHALVGACESVADWLVDNPDADAPTAAGRLMSLLWPGLRRYGT